MNMVITTLREKIILLSELLKSNQKQIMIAKDRTTEEKAQYANGNGKASFVISAQNNEQNAQLGYAQVATNYQKAVLEYKATLDILAP
jgi:outer membrane protein TolC